MLYKVIVKNEILFKGNYYDCLEYIEVNNLSVIPTTRRV